MDSRAFYNRSTVASLKLKLLSASILNYFRPDSFGLENWFGLEIVKIILKANMMVL